MRTSLPVALGLVCLALAPAGCGSRTGASVAAPAAEAGPGDTSTAPVADAAADVEDATPPADLASDLPAEAPPADAGGDAPADGPFSDVAAADAPDGSTPSLGQRTFALTARLKARPPGLVATPIPAELPVTLWLDFERGTAVAGGSGLAVEGTLVQVGPRRWRVERVTFGPGAAMTACSGWMDFHFKGLELDLEGDTLTGSGVGEGWHHYSDMLLMLEVEGTFSGAIDVKPPILEMTERVGPSFQSQHHLIQVTASEPLPRETTLWLEMGSNRHQLKASLPLPKSGAAYRFGADLELPWGRAHRITVEPALVDRAGNAGTVDFTVSRGGLPPLLTDGGFEGPASATLTGTAAITEDAALVIAGKRSIVIPHHACERFGLTARFTVRLAVAPGQTRLRVALRRITRRYNFPMPSNDTNQPRISVGVPGSTTTVDVPFPAGVGPFDGANQRSVGPTVDTTVMLPVGATEVLLDVTQSLNDCVFADSPDGLVIDDVRLE